MSFIALAHPARRWLLVQLASRRARCSRRASQEQPATFSGPSATNEVRASGVGAGGRAHRRLGNRDVDRGRPFGCARRRRTGPSPIGCATSSPRSASPSRTTRTARRPGSSSDERRRAAPLRSRRRPAVRRDFSRQHRGAGGRGLQRRAARSLGLEGRRRGRLRRSARGRADSARDDRRRDRRLRQPQGRRRNRHALCRSRIRPPGRGARRWSTR